MGEVLVVDSQVTLNLVPPKQRIKGTYVVYTLLGLALLGVFVEGVLIYQLYQRIPTQTPQDSVSLSKHTGENKTQEDAYPKNISLTPVIKKTESENRPAAFMHHNNSHNSDTTVMQWGYHGFPALIQGFNYSRGSLIIPKDGLYYLFSKVSFRNNCSMFKHEVKLNSPRYSGQLIVLMVDFRYSCVNQCKQHEKKNQFSSYLGGVWKLYKKDKVFVSVSDHGSLVEATEVAENFFGGFMI